MRQSNLTPNDDIPGSEKKMYHKSRQQDECMHHKTEEMPYRELAGTTSPSAVSANNDGAQAPEHLYIPLAVDGAARLVMNPPRETLITPTNFGWMRPPPSF